MLLSDGKGFLQISLDTDQHRVIVSRSTKDGERAAVLKEGGNLHLQIFIDKSSVEVFVNDGELSFTERVYWQGNVQARLLSSVMNHVDAWQLDNSANTY